MKKTAVFLAKLTIKDHLNVKNIKVRTQYGLLEGWLSVFLNTILFIIKLIMGIMLGSVSLIADAIHTLSDSATSIIVIVGFKMAQKPSDKEHPFGHGRMEPVATLIIAVLLFVAGFEVFKTSFIRFLHPEPSHVSYMMIAIISATILVKEIMARISYAMGELIDSSALKADALHHRTDAISTVLVVVAMIAAHFGWYSFDGAMGMGVALIIIYSAYKIARAAIDPLLGEAPPADMILQIEQIAKKHKGVLGVHDIICHQYGQTCVISLHLEVSDKDSVLRLHAISEAVEDDIEKQLHAKVVTHIDPLNQRHEVYDALSILIHQIIQADTRIQSFHDLRVVGEGMVGMNIIFDLALLSDVKEDAVPCIIEDVERKIKLKYADAKIVIKATPKFAYNT